MCACRSWMRLLALAASLGCVSCSSEGLNPVRGKVLYNDQPIEGVLLTFHPKGAGVTTVLPVGTTKEDGTFTLTTGPDEGAPPGEYVVTAIWPHQGQSRKPNDTRPERFTPEDRFKGQYAKEATSQIKVEIKKGKNELEPFKLQ